MFTRYEKVLSMSKSRELAKSILDAVEQETEVPCGTILSRCSLAEVVDARWIAVMLFHRLGVYPMRIAELMGITPRYAQYIITDFKDRCACNSTLRKIYEKTAKKLGTKYEITWK